MKELEPGAPTELIDLEIEEDLYAKETEEIISPQLPSVDEGLKVIVGSFE